MRKKAAHQNDFATRRKNFLKHIKDGLAIFPSAPETLRNGDVHHAYRQDSNFFYLTGLDEAGSIALLSPEIDDSFQLFVAPRDRTREMWDGKRIGPEGAKKLGADNAHPVTPDSHFDEAFIEALIRCQALYYRLGVDPKFDQRIIALMQRAKRRLGRTGRSLWPILDPSELLGEMRVIKSKGELEKLETAARITADAHADAMKLAKPGMFEYEVEAAIFHSFRARGASRVGYESIVASGENACTLHYVANSRRMESKDLLLIDAGAEFDYYTADVTRTFPVGGQFTPEQKEVYEAVLRVQKLCLREARPGKSLRDIQEVAALGLTEELRELKILKGPTKTLMKNRAYAPYFPHSIGHWIGMDVHDVGRYYDQDYATPRKFESGMALAIEPALYFPSDSDAPAKYKGIGVRIEDDILVTSEGCRVLTSGVPKEADEVESLCSA